MDKQIIDILDKNKLNYKRIYGKELTNKIETGFFLDAIGTNYFKFSQLMTIMKMFKNKEINNGDIFFFSDLWFPGIEAIKYVTSFLNIKVYITGIFHAGSWTETDDVRTYMLDWAMCIENGWFEFIDLAFVGSEHHKQEIIKRKRCNDKNKILVCPLSFDTKKIIKKGNPLPWEKRENNIIFPHRIHWEKQPEIFDDFMNKIEGFTGIKTMEQNLSKEEYYKLLGRSKFVFSSALQENFGYGILEAATLGCIPIVPDSLSYKEYIPKKFRYKNLKQALQIFNKYKDGTVEWLINNDKQLDNGINTMFTEIKNRWIKNE
jgi:glycosyltransferase involved in cell wall biosynthesis